MTDASFTRRLLDWYDEHGRKDLPWQLQKTPYRIWVSEIMLQQTQVTTVIPYFERFTDVFPNVAALAAAPLDRVLHFWSGLGYYARARNLHQAATLVVQRFGGALPSRLEALMELPGVGRSTAGAILAMAFGETATILDGNVKRVLTRIHAIDGWPGEVRVARQLWSHAERHTSTERPADYTQAIMDLGATLCTRSKPACEICPVSQGCQAHRRHEVARFPAPRPKRELPVKHTRMLIIKNDDGEILLEQRPPMGIWGGLWCFPEADPELPLDELSRDGRLEQWARLTHTFTHFRLEIEPILIQVSERDSGVMESGKRLWYKDDAGRQIGLAAPVRKLLSKAGAQEVLL